MKKSFLDFLYDPFKDEAYSLILNCERDEAKATLETIFKNNELFNAKPNITGKFTEKYIFEASPKVEFISIDGPSSFLRNSKMSLNVKGSMLEKGKKTQINITISPNSAYLYGAILFPIAAPIIIMFGQGITSFVDFLIMVLLMVVPTYLLRLHVAYTKNQMKDTFTQEIFKMQLGNSSD